LSYFELLADPVIDRRLAIVISNENVGVVITIHDSGFGSLGHLWWGVRRK
jgi:hypothetical protein